MSYLCLFNTPFVGCVAQCEPEQRISSSPGDKNLTFTQGRAGLVNFSLESGGRGLTKNLADCSSAGLVFKSRRILTFFFAHHAPAHVPRTFQRCAERLFPFFFSLSFLSSILHLYD